MSSWVSKLQSAMKTGIGNVWN